MSKKTDALLAHCQRSYDFNYVRIDDNSQRYEDSWLYYMAKKPEALEVNVNAKEDERTFMEYIEPVVENAVTQITPQVLDIFTEDDQEAVKFRDLSFKPNPVMAEIINKQINRYALQENDGHKILEGALKEALITGDVFTKVYIDEKHENDTWELTDWTDMEQVISTLADKQWQCDLPEGIGNGEKKGEDGGLQWRTVTSNPNTMAGNAPTDPNASTERRIELMGTLDIYKVTKKPKMENVGLRDLIIDTNCGDDFSKCRYICHKMTMTVGDAVDLGYKEGALKSASTNSRLADAPYNKFNLVTNNQIGTVENGFDDDGDPLERWITIYEHYIYSSAMTGGKTSKLYQVHSTDTEYLDHQEIDVMPWVHGQIDTIPESFWGRSMYDKFKFYQDELSINQRLARKNAFNAAYNKVLVTDKQYDAESVINSNRAGAIIIQRQQGAIQPWPYQELPRSFDLQQQNLKESLSKTLGGLVGNINTENGISENAAAQTVAMILSQEQMKSKVTAKTFARTYVRPLYEILYQVIKGNGMTITIPAGTKFKSIPQPTQQDETITSDSFPDLFDFNIDINTNGDKAIAARQIATVWQMLAQTAPSLATPQAAYKVAEAQLQLVNEEVSDYFQDPATIQPSQDEQEMKATQKEGALLQVQLLAAQVAKTTSEAGVNEVKMGSTVQEAQAKVQIMMSESMLKAQKQIADTRNEQIKRAQDQEAIDFEKVQGYHNIVDKNANTLIAAHKTVNGIQN